MDILDHDRGGLKRHPAIDEEARLAPGTAIVAIGVLSLLSWALLISIAMVLWSAA